jgi:3-hydroxyacyl-CoA dehydrogenase
MEKDMKRVSSGELTKEEVVERAIQWYEEVYRVCVENVEKVESFLTNQHYQFLVTHVRVS